MPQLPNSCPSCATPATPQLRDPSRAPPVHPCLTHHFGPAELPLLPCCRVALTCGCSSVCLRTLAMRTLTLMKPLLWRFMTALALMRTVSERL